MGTYYFKMDLSVVLLSYVYQQELFYFEINVIRFKYHNLNLEQIRIHVLNDMFMNDLQQAADWWPPLLSLLWSSTPSCRCRAPWWQSSPSPSQWSDWLRWGPLPGPSTSHWSSCTERQKNVMFTSIEKRKMRNSMFYENKKLVSDSLKNCHQIYLKHFASILTSKSRYN